MTVFIVGEDEGLWDEEVHAARAAGAEHLMLHLEYPPGNGELRERQIRRLRNAIKGIKPILRAPRSWPSLVTPNEELRRLSLQELEATLTVGAKLGADLLIFHGGPDHLLLRGSSDMEERFREGVQELLLLARRLGLELAVENLARGYPSREEELEGALALGLRLSLDLEEARMAGQEPRELVDHFAERLAGVAVSSEVEKEPLIAHLKEGGFAGLLTVDLPLDPDRWPIIKGALAGLRAAWGI